MNSARFWSLLGLFLAIQGEVDCERIFFYGLLCTLHLARYLQRPATAFIRDPLFSSPPVSQSISFWRALSGRAICAGRAKKLAKQRRPNENNNLYPLEKGLSQCKFLASLANKWPSNPSIRLVRHPLFFQERALLNLRSPVATVTSETVEQAKQQHDDKAFSIRPSNSATLKALYSFRNWIQFST